MNKFIQFAILVLAALLTGCTGNNIEIKPLNFTDQIDQLQNLEFQFSREMAPDSLIGLWDSTDYITFDPAVKGKFKWADRKVLIFSPSGSFAPNTDYKATFTEKAANLLRERRNLKNETFNFHTPYLELTSGYAYWSRNENYTSQVELRIRLLFNYPVDQNEVKKYLSLRINDKNEAFNIISTSSSNEMEIASSWSPSNGNVNSLEIVMLEGMRSLGSDRKSTEAVTLKIGIPPVNTLEIIDVTTGFEESTGVITVYTSQPVVAEKIDQQVQVEPAVDFQVTMISNGFEIKGNFSDNQSYRLTLRKTLKGIFGPELGSDQVKEVTFGALAPNIAFADKTGMYLTTEGAANIGLNIINVPKIKVTVFKIFENNIQHFIRMGKRWNWEGDEDGYYENYNYTLDDDFGKVISTREYLTTNLPKNGNIMLLHINPEDLEINSEMKGIYLIKAESTEKAWLQDVQLLSFSDIGLIVREGVDEIFVAARSIATAEPLEGITINFHSSNNQLVHREITGKDGIAVFKDMKSKVPGFRISMISARKAEDFNVLLFSQSAVELSRFETGGKHTIGMDYDVFIYGDRNLYRPGDSVYVNAILRDFRWNTITGIPVIFRIITPDGKDFMKKRVNVNPNGSAMMSFMLPGKAFTGTYTVEVLTVNNVLQGSYRIKVEEFMPDRISVSVKADKPNYLPGEKVNLSITALNLSGPPAAGRKVENELRLTRKSFRPDAYKDYNFSLSSNERTDVISTVSQTVTNEKGVALQQFSLPEAVNAGLIDGKVYTTVFDETGRPVNRLTKFDLYTQTTFVGLKPLPYWLSTDKPISINMIAVNDKQKAVSSKAKMEVVMVDWETILERNYGQIAYRSQRRELVILSKTVNISSNGAVESWTPHINGEYIIKLSIPESNMWVEESFYVYRWGSSDESAFRINKDGQIDITFDKPVYKPGEEAAILFKTPFAGELLVTVEQNKVLNHFLIKSDNSGSAMKLKITDEYLPNVWITATLLRKTSEPGIPLTVAHGFASMQVEKPSDKLPVVITAPQKIRSNVKQPITVKTTPGAEVTIAVVDEGILQITDYKTPDPYGYFYGKRALEVTPYDLFDELLPELASKRSTTGGDQGFDLGKRLNPLTAKRVKLLALWSGRMKADNNGSIKFNAKIPQFSGAVRIMAVAYKDHRFGTGEMSMKVSDPVTISSSLPRFMSPGDQAHVDVTLMNTTNKPLTVNLNLGVSGLHGEKAPFTAGKTDPSRVTIPANSEQRVGYSLTALNIIGTGEIVFKASTASEVFTEKTELGVRPAVPLVKDASGGVLNANTTATLKSSIPFIKGSGSTKLLLTKNPAGQFAKHLEELINYPYGCTEQTVSAVFPQLYFNDLARLLKSGNIQGSELSGLFINEAIRKLNATRQYNGSLSMWPGNNDISWWTSAYAAHFLYEAERAGYTVDKQLTDGLLKYLLEKVKEKPQEKYHYYDYTGKKWIVYTEPAKEIFYSLYVLALNGKHHLPTMNFYKSRLNELSSDSRFLLAGAYRLAGDTKSYEIIVPNEWTSGDIEIMTGRSFNSPVRDRALALYTLVSVDENHPMVAVLARQLGEMLNQRHWLSTQERAFSMLALGKLARSAGSGNPTALISSGGKNYNFKDKDLMVTLPVDEAKITVNGTGKLFWYLESEGLPVSMQVKDEDKILRVRRQLYDRNGKVLAGTVKQGDLIVAGITISTTDNSIVENVVITDLLPACFEIENTRLTFEREMEWIKNRGEPEYLDIRDDRINFFTTASGTPRTFYYMVRVVGKGSFTQGPVGAEAMYNGQYYSYFGQRKITSL